MFVQYDVVSIAVVDPTGMKAHVKFGDSRSNLSRDIRLAQMRDERTTPAYADHHIRAKRHYDVLSKKNTPQYGIKCYHNKLPQ